MCDPHFRSGQFCFPSSREGQSEIIWNSSARELSLLPHGSLQSLVCTDVDSWLFIVYLGYSPVLLLFVAQIVPALVIGSSVSGLLGTQHTSCCGFF